MKTSNGPRITTDILRREGPTYAECPPDANGLWKGVGDYTHNTKVIPVKLAAVDKEIVPVVNWINSFSDAFTLYSCEGSKNPHSKCNPRPYVSFVCRHTIDLKAIREATKKHADEFSVTIEESSENTMYVHCIKFKSYKSMKSFCKRLKEGKVKGPKYKTIQFIRTSGGKLIAEPGEWAKLQDDQPCTRR